MTVTLTEINRRHYGYSYDKSAINNHAERTYIVIENDQLLGGILIDCCTDVLPKEFRAAHVGIYPETLEIVHSPVIEVCLPESVQTWNQAIEYVRNHFNENFE